MTAKSSMYSGYLDDSLRKVIGKYTLNVFKRIRKVIPIIFQIKRISIHKSMQRRGNDKMMITFESAKTFNAYIIRKSV